jgi:hypothetical protein
MINFKFISQHGSAIGDFLNPLATIIGFLATSLITRVYREMGWFGVE